jgi:hypothetical protein
MNPYNINFYTCIICYTQLKLYLLEKNCFHILLINNDYLTQCKKVHSIINKFHTSYNIINDIGDINIYEIDYDLNLDYNDLSTINILPKLILLDNELDEIDSLINPDENQIKEFLSKIGTLKLK